jgi:outer membrane lipoprotein-sorting protein
MNNEKNDLVQQAVDAVNQAPIPNGPSEALIRQTLEHIADETPQSKPNIILERMKKMKPIGKVAAAAIVIIGISMLFLFTSTPGNIALADVYARVQQAQAFMYKMSMTMTGTFMEGTPPQNMESEGTVTVSTEYGMKMQNTMHLLDQDKTMIQEMYILPAEKKMVQVMPSEKAYMTMTFSEDLLEKMKEQNNDPRDTIKKMLESEYTDLGFSEIDGIKVQGFQTNDPAYAGGMVDDINVSVWVDAKTWLPVRSEFSMKMGDDTKMEMVVHEFIWDIAVQASDFVPVIPDDYKSMGNVELPKMDENGAIEGLRYYAELAGNYPEKLDLMNLMKSLGKLRNSETEAAIQLKQQMKDAGTEEEKAQLIMEQMMPIQSVGMFYAFLTQEKRDPMYYGNQVTPEDTDAVLMRWKQDDGKYKVIFGDLSTVEMEYEDLIKIEPEPLPEPIEVETAPEEPELVPEPAEGEMVPEELATQ